MDTRQFENFPDFLRNKKININYNTPNQNKKNFSYSSSNLISNKTEPSSNNNRKLIKYKNSSQPQILLSLRNKIKYKGKNNLVNSNLDTKYSTFYSNNEFNTTNIKNDKNKINNTFNDNIIEKKKNLKIFSLNNDYSNNHKVENTIFSYKNKVNNYTTKNNDNKNNNLKNNRTFSFNNNYRNKNSEKRPSLEKKNNLNKKMIIYKKYNNFNNYNNFLNNNTNNRNSKKVTYLSKGKPRLSSDSFSLNKEIEHLLSSYDFNNFNYSYYKDLIPDEKSMKIHFRNLLYLVKELEAKNNLLTKELRNKNNLISSLENQLNNNKEIEKNNINNKMLKEYNDNILLDNNKLKSEILNLENKLKQQKIHYEDIISDYENKLNEEKNKNDIMDNNLKNIENKYKNSNNKIFDMKDELKDVILKKAKLEDINEKHEVINIEQKKRIEELENQLKVLLTLIKDLFNKEKNVFYPMRIKLFYDISNLGKNANN